MSKLESWLRNLSIFFNLYDCLKVAAVWQSEHFFLVWVSLVLQSIHDPRCHLPPYGQP